MVEYHLAKVAVAGSSPVARSTLKMEQKPADNRRVFHFKPYPTAGRVTVIRKPLGRTGSAVAEPPCNSAT